MTLAEKADKQRLIGLKGLLQPSDVDFHFKAPVLCDSRTVEAPAGVVNPSPCDPGGQASRRIRAPLSLGAPRRPHPSQAVGNGPLGSVSLGFASLSHDHHPLTLRTNLGGGEVHENHVVPGLCRPLFHAAVLARRADGVTQTRSETIS